MTRNAGGDRRRSRGLGWRLGPLVPLVPAWVAATAAIAGVATRRSAEIDRLLLDPNFTAGVAWYTGLVSNLAVLTWAAAASAAFWGAWWCRMGGRSEAGRFLFWGGALGAYLMFDDLWQLHAVAWPTWFGWSKPGVELAVVFATLAWMARFSRELGRTRWPVLVAAGLAMAVSMGFDRYPVSSSPSRALLFEDGAKLLGIAAWAAYFVATTADIGRSLLAERAGSPAASLPGASRRPARAGRGDATPPPVEGVDVVL